VKVPVSGASTGMAQRAPEELSAGRGEYPATPDTTPYRSTV